MTLVLLAAISAMTVSTAVATARLKPALAPVAVRSKDAEAHLQQLRSKQH